jgi:hypothetical protein
MLVFVSHSVHTYNSYLDALVANRALGVWRVVRVGVREEVGVFGEEVRDDVVGRLVGRVVEVGVVEAGVERVAWGAAAVALEGVVAVVVRHFFCVCVFELCGSVVVVSCGCEGCGDVSSGWG